MAAIVSQGSYSASSIATIFTATADCTVSVRITNKSGSAGTITENSRSTGTTTDATGMLLGDVAIADNETLELTGIVLNTSFENILLTCDVNLNYVFSGAEQ